jgi:hypothetical protein
LRRVAGGRRDADGFDHGCLRRGALGGKALVAQKLIKSLPIKNYVGAVSVGMVGVRRCSI